MSERKYFGTDGIRGRVGDPTISADFMLRLGRAIGKVLASDPPKSVLIGKDTRISGYMIESALEAGLSAAGANIRLLGPMPTPAVAYLTRTMRAGAGIVISASHNPYQDNGIKLFSSTGEKLPDAVERAIEDAVEEPFETVPADRLGKAERVEDAAGRYLEFCKSTVSERTSLSGLHLVVDCANGATYQVGPKVFRELGARVTAIGAAPDGLNINRDCGSTHLEQLSKTVVAENADLGIAFDGDGDRVLMVDHTGSPVDGDELLFLIARARHEAGTLGEGVVGTQMSNLGLEHALGQRGIRFHRARVGDRHVLKDMKDRAWRLGGESSGHIIALDKTTTGDGIISALSVLEALVASGQPLATFRQGMKKYPQVMINVPVRGKIDLKTSRPVQDALARAENSLSGSGRVILRPSGTEPLIRVTVEGEDADRVNREAERLADVVRSEFSN